MQLGWKAAVERTLLAAWGHKGALGWSLLPVALLYAALSVCRKALFRYGLLTQNHVGIPVIVVGNVVAGGAGKTPTVIGLVKHLRHRGVVVGVISRGYGRSSKDCVSVTADSIPADAGDEPLLIARHTGAPVFVADSRFQAAMALRDAYPQVQVLVADDGLQHFALHRDIDICVFDERGLGNGWLLPAGPLREAWPRRTPTVVLHTGSTQAFGGFRAQRQLAQFAMQQDGTRIPLAELSRTRGKPLAAVAGIARPQVFFDMLKTLGLPIADALALPDHYDFDSLPRKFHGHYQLICTEKDAAKLWQTVPSALAIPLEQTAEPAFYAAIESQLQGIRGWPVSFSHGHTTT